MSSSRSRCIGIAWLMILGLGSGSLVAQSSLKVQRLKSLETHSWSRVAGISKSGDVVGSSVGGTGCESPAVLWERGRRPPLELPLPPPANWAEVNGINSGGVSIGRSFDRANCSEYQPLPCEGVRPVVWNAGLQPTVLTLPAEYESLGWARDVNDSGEIVGSAYEPDSCLRSPIYWDAAGNATRLGLPPGYPEAWAKAVRVDDTTPFLAAGTALAESGYKAVAWSQSGTAMILEDLPRYSQSGITDMNRKGTIVGESFAVREQAVRWTPQGKPEHLMPPAGLVDDCVASGINDSGVTVGWCVAQYGPRYRDAAVAWAPDGTGRILEPLPAWSQDCHAERVNNEGVIVGACLVVVSGGWMEIGVVWRERRPRHH